jgi:anti-sigma-K factor RskA
MKCADVNRLAPFYVAGALRRREISQIDAHLRTCPDHSRLIADLQSGVLASASAIAMTPSSTLKSKLMTAIESDVLNANRHTKQRSPLGALSWPGIAATAAVLLIIFAGLIWHFQFQTPESAFEIALNGASGASGTLSYDENSEEGLISVEGLPRLPAAQTYQVWAAVKNGARNCGQFNTSDEGIALAKMEGDVSRDQIVFVTVEPAGGSARPTGQVVLTRSP